MDPIADKITSLTVPPALYINGGFPGPLLGLIVAKDLILSSGSVFAIFRHNMKSILPPVRPTLISKVNTFTQSAYIMSLLTLGFIDSNLLFYFVKYLEEPILYATSSATLISYISLALRTRKS